MPAIRAWWGALLGAVAIASAPSASVAADPTLPLAEALRRAEAGSPDVQAADAALQATRGRAQQAGLGPNPEARLAVESFAGSGQYRGAQSVETTLSVAQALELGGKRRTRVGAATAEVKAADVRLAVARVDLVHNVEDRYAEAWAAQGTASR